jgi:dethiobiotin synthetase
VIVVVGSGTDVGKTFVTCCLLRQLTKRGIKIAVRKPVITGGGESTGDTGMLLRAAGQIVDDASIAATSPLRFAAPLAPDEAARAEGKTLLLRTVVDALHFDDSTVGAVQVVETAGGVMSPVAEDGLVIDAVVEWKKRGRLDVLLVVGDGVGSITHGLSAAAVLVQSGCAPQAVVVNRPQRCDAVPFAYRRFLPAGTPVFTCGSDLDQPGALLSVLLPSS